MNFVRAYLNLIGRASGGGIRRQWMVVLTAWATLIVAESSMTAGQTTVEAVPVYGPVVDEEILLLKPPPDWNESGRFSLAEQPPRVTFTTIRDLPALTEVDRRGGLWSCWGEGVWASNGKVYVTVGNHRGIDGNCYLYEYDPATHASRPVLDVAALAGQRPGEWGQGKIHGRLDEMPDGWIYFATYWGEFPDRLPPDRAWRTGGLLAGYNCRTGEHALLGMPLGAESWPMFATDTARGVFHAVGARGSYLAYDLRGRRPLYCGPLPGDIVWGERATMIDPRTGICYSTSDGDGFRIVGYDPARNVFFDTRAFAPRNTAPDLRTAHHTTLRCYTRRRLPDGSLLCQTYDGVIFKFFPDQERIETIGTNWGSGLYCTSMVLSPDARRAYYTIGAHGNAWRSGCPIIELDTTTGARRVLCFLHPFYQDRHGYTLGGAYTILIDPPGRRLLVFWNGRFRDPQDQGESFGHPAFMLIELPERESPASRPS